jgi:hypothetical protein
VQVSVIEALSLLGLGFREMRGVLIWLTLGLGMNNLWIEDLGLPDARMGVDSCL